MHKILIIDDDEFIRDLLQSFLQDKGFYIRLAHDGLKGLNLIREEDFSVILCDLVIPGIQGMDILRVISASKINIPFIVITGFGTIQTAVEAMKMGAFDYITKPFNLEELLIIINRAIDMSKLQKENIMLKKQLKKKYNFKGIIGNSPGMQKVYEVIERIADTDSTVLIIGERGTGKELIAKTLHYNSSRAQGPFVPVNCTAIPNELLESELFGHEKDSFAGALNTRVGRFELANKGTLFLDEVAELAPSLQVKLLRLLQGKEFERVGGTTTIKVDLRILVSTNKDLEKITREGNFREDLFYRLNVIPLHIPPLRNRTEDIPLLVDYFVNEFSRKKKRKPLAISKEAMDCFYNYMWTDNVRELEKLIERLTILVSGDIVKVSDLPEKYRQLSSRRFKKGFSTSMMHDYINDTIGISVEGIKLNEVVEDIERNMILKALEKTGGIKSRSASILGLNRTTLIEKMKKMGIISHKYKQKEE